MTFIVAYVPDNYFEMLPDHLFQNDSPDEVSRARTCVAPVVYTNEMILSNAYLYDLVLGKQVLHLLVLQIRE